MTRSFFFEAFFDPSDPSEPVFGILRATRVRLRRRPLLVLGLRPVAAPLLRLCLLRRRRPRLRHRRERRRVPRLVQPQHRRLRDEPLKRLSRRRRRGHRAQAQRILLRARERVPVRRHQVHERPPRQRRVNLPVGTSARRVGPPPSHVPHASNMNAVTSAAAYVCSAAAATPTPSFAASRRIAPIASLHARAATAATAAGAPPAVPRPSSSPSIIADPYLAAPRVQRRAPVRVQHGFEKETAACGGQFSSASLAPGASSTSRRKASRTS